MKTLIVTSLLTCVSLHGTTLVSSSLSSTDDTDITAYTVDVDGNLSEVNPSSMVVDPLLSGTILSGTATSAGGNVELYSGSDGLIDMSASGAFANAVPVVLNTSHSTGGSIEVRSLNGQDWFVDNLMTYNVAYGADNLANQYFEDLRQTVVASTVNADIVSALTDATSTTLIYNNFLTSGGFAQISDPNVSYVHYDSNGQAVVGLGGFQDTSLRVLTLLGYGDPTQMPIWFPNGLQSSEVAVVNGTAVYSFSSVDSGVVLDDGVDSYNATYEMVVPSDVSVPEPSSALLGLLGLIGLLGRRKR